MATTKTIIIEGLIGAGKSTLGHHLNLALRRRNYPQTIYLTEPDETSNPYLADYYQDPGKWAFTMQIYLLQERYRQHLQAQWHVMSGMGHAVMDRSYFGDVAFAYIQLQLGHMSQRDFDTYKKLYTVMTAHVLFPKVCVHLLVDPVTSQDRIQTRIKEKSGRDCEDVIERSYLEYLDREIHNVVGLLERQGTIVHRIPWNDPGHPDTEDYKQRVYRLAEWIDDLELHSAFPDFHRRLT